LFETFGNPKAVERAIQESYPNRAKIEEYREHRGRIASSIAKIKEGRARLIRFVTKGTLTDAEVQEELDELRQKETRLEAELTRLCDAIANVPTPDAVRIVAKQTSDAFRNGQLDGVKVKLAAKIRHANHVLDDMTWEEKRALAETVFNGSLPDGRPMGIYIEAIHGQTDYRRKRWRFTLHGNLIDGDQLVTQSMLYCTTTSPPVRRSWPPRLPVGA
jgi:hypothetical protein